MSLTVRNIVASIAMFLVGAAIVLGAAIGFAGTASASSPFKHPNWTDKGQFYDNNKGDYYRAGIR
jgi:hypothetical protein